MSGRFLCSITILAFVVCASLSAQAVHHVDVNHREQATKSAFADADSDSSHDGDADEEDNEDDKVDEGQNDDSNDDATEEDSSEPDHDPDADSLAEQNAHQTPKPMTWEDSLKKQQENGLIIFTDTKPIKLHWLWHQAMCLEADLQQNMHHAKNMHINECIEPTPDNQRFEYDKETHQIKLHYLDPSIGYAPSCLDRDGDNLIFHECKGHRKSQKFVFDSGTDHIRNAFHGGKVVCLHVDAGEAKAGDLYVNRTNVNLRQCIGSETNQKWKPVNLLDSPKMNFTRAAQEAKTERVTVEEGQDTASIIQQSRPKATSATTPPTIPQYYPMLPPGIPQYYQQPQFVGYQRYAQNPNLMMPASMTQVAQGRGTGSVPHAAPHMVGSMTRVQQGAQATPALNKTHQSKRSASLVSVTHAATPHPQTRGPMEDAVDIAASTAALKKAADSLSPLSSINSIDASVDKADPSQSEHPKTEKPVDSSSLDPDSDSTISSSGDSLFRGLDDILGHENKAHTRDVMDLPSSSPSPEADNSVSGAGDLDEPRTDASNPQLSSLNDILGDLNKAGQDISDTDEPVNEKAKSRDDALAPASLLDTSLEVGSAGALLRRSE